MIPKFPWKAFHVVCGGISIIDIPQLELENEAEAHQFLATYGYDLFDPSHIEQIWKIYERACQFIEMRLCGPFLEFPVILKDKNNMGDFKNVLLLAAGRSTSQLSLGKELQPWACGILRVMHAVSHLQSDLRLKYLPKIKRQTIDRFEAHIQRTQEGENRKIYLGFERDKVPLFDFQKKESKVRHSVLLKLLHRPERTAQEIYDHIGVRFITHTRAETFLVLKYLVDHHLVSYPNVMPARFRNSLLDIKDFERLFQAASQMRPEPKLEEIFEKIERQAPFPKVDSEANRFSADDYHAFQFTGRRLIRIPVVRKGGVKGEISFFFPVEVQITDKASYEASIGGNAGHALYKQKQLESVRERVLKGLVS